MGLLHYASGGHRGGGSDDWVSADLSSWRASCICPRRLSGVPAASLDLTMAAHAASRWLLPLGLGEVPRPLDLPTPLLMVAFIATYTEIAHAHLIVFTRAHVLTVLV